MELSAPTRLTLEEVQSHFEHWRSTRHKRTKIPETLWQEVFFILKHYPYTKVLQTLRLNGSQLKTKIQIYSNDTFIKLEPPINTSSAVTDESANCIVQLYHHKGSRMSIHIQQGAFLKEIVSTFIQA